MKNLRLLSLLMVLISSFLFIQCTSEPIPGLPGANGTNGAPGTNGVDGTTSCVNCHSNSHRDVINAQYDLSKHAIETTMYDGRKLSQYGNRANCAACHTNQGFIDRFTIGDINLVGPYSTTSDQKITCTSCHDKNNGHRSFDFANDGNDYALRTLDPVTLIIDPTISIDSKNNSDLLGYSNTCINCHQPRTPAPMPNTYGNYKVTSPYWGPHHGPQGTFLYGIGGAILPGAMPAIGAAGHATGASCVACHMGETTDGTDGGHTWHPTANACIKCHSAEPLPSEIKNVNGTTLADLRAQLLIELQTKGLDSTGTKYIFDTNGKLQLGTYPVKVTQAAFNYLLLNEDRSNGIHNPEYALDLVQNSINALQ